MAYTSHGHHIPGSVRTRAPRAPAACGGVVGCETCQAQKAAWARANEEGIEPPVFSSTVYVEPTTPSTEPSVEGYWIITICWDEQDDAIVEQPTLERIFQVLDRYSKYRSFHVEFVQFKDPTNC